MIEATDLMLGVPQVEAQTSPATEGGSTAYKGDTRKIVRDTPSRCVNIVTSIREYAEHLIAAGREADVEHVLGVLRSLSEAYGASSGDPAGEAGAEPGIDLGQAARDLEAIEQREADIIKESGKDIADARAPRVSRTPRKQAGG